MKILFTLLTAMVFLSCKNEIKPTYVIISGTVENGNQETVMVRGANSFEAKMSLSESGSFSDTLAIVSDDYYTFYVGRERTGIYMERGNNIGIIVNLKEFDETITYSGESADVNNYLAVKYLAGEQAISSKDLYSLNEEDFKHELETQNKASLDLLKSKMLTNDTFVAKEQMEINYDHIVQVENFQDAHRYYSKIEDFTVSHNFYDVSEDINFSDTTAYRNSQAYRRLISAYFSRLVADKLDSDNDLNNTITYLNIVDERLPDGYAKDQLMTENLRYGLSPDEYIDETFAIYKNSNPSAENFELIQKNYTKLKAVTPGNVTPNFDYENFKGGTTILNELRGKYVYIDVWATWCGPCIREIPSLKEVENDYHKQNIEFVSLSIDSKKDYEKWRNMVTEKELSGIQLVENNGGDTAFINDYVINSIPRFILIDPEGKIIAADALRPSDPNLRVMLDKLL